MMLQDLTLLEATKTKLRHWVADRAGICLHGRRAQHWIDVLTETSNEIRRCAAVNAQLIDLPAEGDDQAALWDWITTYATSGLTPIPAISLLHWANALDSLATEIYTQTAKPRIL